MLVDDTRKKFEKPGPGEYVAVIADIVDLGMQPRYGGGEALKLRIEWLLNANDSTGKPLSTIQTLTQSMNEKATLFAVVKQILGETPKLPYDPEQLIGVSRRVYIQHEPNKKTGEPFPKIMAIMPLNAGQQPMTIPVGYARYKDRKTNTNYANAAPVPQTAAPAPTTGMFAGPAGPQPPAAPQTRSSF